MPKQDLTTQTIWLKHINAPTLNIPLFNIIHDAIAPLQAHAHYDLPYAWDTYVHHMQHVIKVYGKSFVTD